MYSRAFKVNTILASIQMYYYSISTARQIYLISQFILENLISRICIYIIIHVGIFKHPIEYSKLETELFILENELIILEYRFVNIHK
jgi:hypothetical protein